jgi:hypothetical protein
MVNGPPCTICGYPLRWFGEQNAWGCDRCQRMFPAAPPAHAQQQPHARAGGKSKLPLLLGIGGVIVAGAVVTIVLVMKGGGGGGQSSPKALVDKTLAALTAGDASALVDLTGMEKNYSTMVKCDDTADDKDKDPAKMKEKAMEHFSKLVEKSKGLTIEVTSMPDIDARDKDKDIVLPKGEKMGKGCVTNAEVRIVKAEVKVKVKDGDKPANEQQAKIEMLLVDGKWYLAEPPKISKGGGAGAQIAKMAEFRDQMCACKDLACTKKVSDDMTTWAMDAAKNDPEPPRMTEEDTKKATQIGEEMGQCMQKAAGMGSLDSPALAGDDPPPPPPEEEDDAPAKTATATGPSGLPKECDDWGAEIDKLGACPKLGKDAVAAMKKGYNDAVAAWKKLPESTRAQLAPSCKQAADGMRKNFKTLCGS